MLRNGVMVEPSRKGSPVFPWNDRAGRLPPLKLATFMLVLAPAVWIAWLWATQGLGPKPVTEAIHRTGDWTVRLLIATLAVTPLRRIANYPKLILVRRMLGLAVLGYSVLHLSLYALDLAFDLTRIATEIVLRIYLLIGFTALLGLVALGATSTDAAIRRLGANWHRLHRVIYAIAVLALAHYFLQAKLNVTQPVLWSGFFLLVMGYRLIRRFELPEGPLGLVALAAAAGVATALLEAGWYAAATGANAALVLGANLEFEYEIRPAWYVLAVGLTLSLVALARRAPAPRQRRRSQALETARA
jgi:methionine sulfoxide reductase heme-binding subunit